MFNVILKDDSRLKFEEPISIYEVVLKISEGLARNACAAMVDGQVCDLRFFLDKDCRLEILTFSDEWGRGAFRHTTSHIMAQAVKRLFPEVKLAIGPKTDDGFYYDFDGQFSLDDLPKIETEMKKIVKEALPIERFELPKDKALEFMKDEPYKVELIENLPDGAIISFYRQGEFTDLCAGPHLMNTKFVKTFKLTSIAGAYWHGDEKNKMLTRIYGTAFTKASELNEYLERIEEAKKRDHRKLGRELGLFTILDEAPGMPFFLPKGQLLKNILLNYWRKIHKRAGYDEISTPLILNKELWLRSGHWDHYRNNMYTTLIDDQDFAIKPMNCPGAILVYKTGMHSYRELPLRYAEPGIVHRHEKSGTLHGLMRVRCFTQDDAHIFIAQDQIKSEVFNVITLIQQVYNLFGFKYHLELSTRPEDSMGTDEQWETATNALKSVLIEKNIEFKVNEGDGAFYGPKIDFHLEDSLGRTWQCGTIQLDFQLPEKFDLEYTGKDNEKHRPIMIHRVAFGSIERFIGILIENYGGHFPTWLAPVQVKILPISDKFNDYAQKIFDKLDSKDIRVEIDLRAEKIGYKIREAKLEKVPYLVVIGQKEMDSNQLSVRTKDIENITVETGEFVNKILEEIEQKKEIDW